jgi:DNA-binding response OmpR family regulator
VTAVESAEEAVAEVARGPVSLVLLDLMLPGMSGFALCERLRNDGARVPIIILTARTHEQDRIRGLDLGADDYVSKPFSVRELLARVRAQLRREGVIGEPDDSEFVIGDIRVNLRTSSVTRRNRHLELSPHEFELLRYLIAHRGEVVSREQLLRDVWGYSQLSVTRTVDNYIFRLRNHVEPRPHDPRFILTVHGSGYRLVV